MWNRADLKAKGKAAMKANYWKCVLVSLILSIVTAASTSGGGRSNGEEGRSTVENITHKIQEITQTLSPQQILGIIAIITGALSIGIILVLALQLLVKNILIVGCNGFFASTCQYQDPALTTVISGFKKNYKNNVITMLLKNLFVFLWSLLLVIPGIIKAYEYRMIPYILADNPDITWQEAFAESKAMMTGNKWNAFVLDLSFIGWYILGAITCGILYLFWVSPYQHATNAQLYLALKNN